MRSLTDLIWRNLMQRKLRAGLSIFGVMLGVALFFAAACVGASPDLSALQPSDFVSVQALSTTGQYLDMTVADRARAVPGVAAVSPVLTAGAALSSNLGASLTLNGVLLDQDALLHHREIAAGSPLSGPDQVLLPEDWAARNQITIGSMLNVLVVGNGLPRPLSLKVVGLLTPAAFAMAPDAITTLDTLQQATGLVGKVALMQVRYQDSADPDTVEAALHAALGETVSLVVYSSLVNGNPVIIFIIDAVLATAGVAILLTAAYLIFNTFTLTLAERRTEIGRLIAIGMTPRQAATLMLTEAALLGGIGSGLGLLLGAALTYPVKFAINTATGQAFRPVPLWLPGAVLAVLLGIGITLLAASPIARQASRISPLEMIFAERRPKTRRLNASLIAGTALMALGGLAVIGLAANLSQGFGLLLGTVAQNLLLLGGIVIMPALLIRWFHRLRTWVGTRWGLNASLALSNLDRQAARSALTATALTVVTASIVMMAGLSADVSESENGAVHGFMNVDYMILSGGSANPMMAFSSARLLSPSSPTFYSDLDALQIGSVSRLGYVTSVKEITSLPGFGGVIALDVQKFLTGSGKPYKGATLDQTLQMFAAGPAIILSKPNADRLKVGVGDSVTLDTLTGPVAFKVAGIEDKIFFSYMDYAQAERYYNAVTLLMVGVRLRPGIQAADIEPTLRKLVESNGLQLASLDSFIDALTAFFSNLGAAFSVLGLLTMIVAALGILGTMYTSVMERQRELGILAAIGGTPGQLRTVVLIEALGLAVSGAVPGIVIGLIVGLLTTPINQLADRAANTHLWDGGTIVIPWLVLFITLIGTPIVALLATSLPLQRVNRMQVVDALRYQ